MKLVATSIFALVTLLGCAGSIVLTEIVDNQAIPDPSSDMAQIVFLRPSAGNYSRFSAIIFDVTDSKNDIIGVAPSWSKFVVNMSPGEHRLLSTISVTQGHIMEMDVDAGQRYFVLVRPIWGQGFQLRPLTQTAENNYSQKNPSFPRWLKKTKLVEMSSKEVRNLQAKAAEIALETKEKAEKVWGKKNDLQRAELTLSNNDFEAK